MKKKSKVLGYRIGEFEGIKREYKDDNNRTDIGTRPIPSWKLSDKKNKKEIRNEL